MSGMLIIGGGMAGGHAARQLRREGYSGEITVLADEHYFPYERPPLSKGVLQGAEQPSSVFITKEGWYKDQRVTMRTGMAAAAIHPDTHEVMLESGEMVSYEKLLIATGSRARVLPIPGHDLPGVYMLRTLDDALVLRDAIAAGDKRVVLIGSGWIGMEVAASARMLGNSVTVLERGSVPLAAALGELLGTEFRKMHEQHGVNFVAQAKVEGVTGAEAADGVRVTGGVIPADVVVIGVGSVPNTALAEAAGIAVDGGILVDAALRTSVPDVFAAGDIASVWSPAIAQHLRSEHWANALGQGKAAARSMLGQDVAYNEIPYFYTDQYDLSMELSGYPSLMTGAELVIRGSLETRAYVAFWLRDGAVVAGMNVNTDGVNV